MKPSTACELAGFALLSYAAYRLYPIAGLAVAGAFLLLIGYALDDGAVAVSAKRIVAPVARARTRRKLKRTERAAKKAAKKTS